MKEESGVFKYCAMCTRTICTCLHGHALILWNLCACPLHWSPDRKFLELIIGRAYTFFMPAHASLHNHTTSCVVAHQHSNALVNILPPEADIFRLACENSPAIIFIDEIDTLVTPIGAPRLVIWVTGTRWVDLLCMDNTNHSVSSHLLFWRRHALRVHDKDNEGEQGQWRGMGASDTCCLGTGWVCSIFLCMHIRNIINLLFFFRYLLL